MAMLTLVVILLMGIGELLLNGSRALPNTMTDSAEEKLAICRLEKEQETVIEGFARLREKALRKAGK